MPSARNRKLRVLHVVPSLDEGGAAKAAVEVVDQLNETGDVDARLCVLGTACRAIYTLRIPDKVTFLNCPTGERTLTLRRWGSLRGTVRQIQPDVVHSHLWPTAANIAWALTGSGIPHVVHIRDSPPAFAESRWQSVMKRRLTALAIRWNRPRLVAVSEAAADYTGWHLGLRRNGIRVLIDAVDLTDFLAVPFPWNGAGDRPIVVGTAGRLVGPKGHRFLLDAVIRLRNESLPVVLQIAGTGSERAALERQSNESGHSSAISFSDYRPDVNRFYEELDIYAFPSLSAEGLSRTLIEAMASGRPVVATDCTGTQEAVRHQQDGIIVPTGDSSALAGALRELVLDAGKRRRMGEAARQRASEQFSIERVISELVRLYTELSAPRA